MSGRWPPGPHEAEFQQFVTEALPVLLRAAVALCRDRPTAEDLVQTTFVRMARRWPAARSAPLPYARRVLVNLTRDRARHAARHPTEALGERHLHVVGDEDQSGGVDRRLMLLRALHELPERQRAVLVLRFYLDLSVLETARLLHLAPGTVKSTTSRALDRLGALLDEDGAGGDVPAPTPASASAPPPDDEHTATGGKRC